VFSWRHKGYAIRECCAERADKATVGVAGLSFVPWGMARHGHDPNRIPAPGVGIGTPQIFGARCLDVMEPHVSP